MDYRVSRSFLTILDQILTGDINLEPEYQRGMPSQLILDRHTLTSGQKSFGRKPSKL